ncbi:hypothetical protein KO465_04065 [Candidatus Micrarchaeota archaeon]|nr:hypothetical protein [Candidatus Micrarchaeota archaeon]
MNSKQIPNKNSKIGNASLQANFMNPESITSLSAIVSDIGLNDYYANQNIPRVNNFINWVQNNNAKLTKEFKADLINGKIEFDPRYEQDYVTLFGIWMGARYISSIYQLSEQQRSPNISSKISANNSEFKVSWQRNGTINIWFPRPDPRNDEYTNMLIDFFRRSNPVGIQERFICGFNIGLHEATHGLTNINLLSGRMRTSLSEIATAYTQTEYSLPIVGKSEFRLWMGIRDPLVMWDQKNALRISNYEFEDTFFSFLIIPWLKNHYAEKGQELDIFEFTTPRVENIVFSDFIKYDERTRTYSLDMDLGKYFRQSGLKNPEICMKLENINKKMMGNRYRNTWDLLNDFFKNMDAEFGVPKESDIPLDYVEFFKKDNTLSRVYSKA